MAEPRADKPASPKLDADPAAPAATPATEPEAKADARVTPPEEGADASVTDGDGQGVSIEEVAPEAPGAPAEASSSASAPLPPPASTVGPQSVVVQEAKKHDEKDHHGGGYLAALTLGALGIVYGDIGTSPLYALRECFRGSHGVPVTPHNVYGVLSLVCWSLILIISIKYLSYVLRADNKGEGGTLALMALASSALKSARGRTAIALVGVFGSALVYGDGMITPAISVLSAVEGLELAAESLHAYVVPITIAILVGLFAIQRHGTARVGALFGPIMVIWFATLGVLGLLNVLHHPEILIAVSPSWAVLFFQENAWAGLSVLGSVVLVITGGEALYADLGHFGKRPIRLAWFGLVSPALILNYFGQGALIIYDPGASDNPFFKLAPEWGLYPLIALSTCATVIASQAMISGVYSLTRAAAMLGFLPRMNVQHTSAHERGQVYVPSINWMLMLAAIALVLGFRSSSNLAAAYGIAVTMTMVLTTVMAYWLTRRAWGWSVARSLAVTSLFLIPELFFTGANLAKIPHGGWFPLVMGAGLFVVMTTWKRGRAILFQRFQEKLLPLSDFHELMHVELPARVPGTAVFMTSADGTPPAMLHNFLHNRVVHQHIVLLTIVTSDDARVDEKARCKIEELDQGFVRLTARYGFMERPDVPKLLLSTKLITNVEHTTFFLGRETMIATERPGMARWRVHLFAFLARNALPATRFFNIPPDRVMEIGAQIEL